MPATLRNIRRQGNVHIPGHGVLAPGQEFTGVDNAQARKSADGVNIAIMEITPDEPKEGFKAEAPPEGAAKERKRKVVD